MRTTFPNLIATFVTLCSTLWAGNAVSGFNGKVSASHGDFDSFAGESFQGSVAFPLSAKWGAQFDGLYNRIDGLDFGGAGGHVFWRDSAQALVGLSASAVNTTHSTNYQAGLEAEYYFPWVTVGAFAGVGGIRYDVDTPFIDTDRRDLAGTFYLGFYPLPDLLVRPKLSLAHRNLGYGVELEYGLPRYNLAVIAESLHAGHDFQQHQLGLRFYFGGKKSLKARHREDDPVSGVADTLNALGTYGAEYNNRAKAFLQRLTATSPEGATGYYGSFLTITGDQTYTVTGSITGATLQTAPVAPSGSFINLGSLNSENPPQAPSF